MVVGRAVNCRLMYKCCIQEHSSLSSVLHRQFGPNKRHSGDGVGAIYRVGLVSARSVRLFSLLDGLRTFDAVVLL